MSALRESLVAQFQRVAPQLAGADVPWIRERRDSAIARFSREGLPSLRQEEWKYTDLAPLAARTLSLATTPSGDFETPDSKWHAVFVDGRLSREHSALPPPNSGISVKTIAQLAQTDAQALKAIWPADDEHSLTALNTAFANDGLVITLDKDAQAAAPLHVVFAGSGVSDRFTTPLLLVNAGANSRMQLIEEHRDNHGFSSAKTLLETEPGAQIDHYRLVDEVPGCIHYGRVRTRCGSDARISSTSIVLKGGLCRIDVDSELASAGASCDLNGLFLVGENEHVDHHTTITHAVGNTDSTQHYHGIADNNGRGVFNGKVIVKPDAQKISAVQSSRNLLLSDRAEIDTKPELEIYADDVKCSHGATVGQLDETAVFYLRSRGIDAPTARALVTYAFAAEIVAKVPISALLQRIESHFLDTSDYHATLEGLM